MTVNPEHSESSPGSKLAELRNLGAQRHSARWEGYGCVQDYHGGAYESDHVSPYTKSAPNVDSPVFVLLQDWASDDYLREPIRPCLIDQGRDPSLWTNTHLDALLQNHFDLQVSEVYATNLFPFVKPGKMNAYIPAPARELAAREYAIPQIRIVAPRLVISLGIACFNSLRKGCDRRLCKSVEVGLASPFECEGAMVWCQSHPGSLGKNRRNRDAPGQVDRDWQLMANWFHGGDPRSGRPGQ